MNKVIAGLRVPVMRTSGTWPMDGYVEIGYQGDTYYTLVGSEGLRTFKLALEAALDFAEIAAWLNGPTVELPLPEATNKASSAVIMRFETSRYSSWNGRAYELIDAPPGADIVTKQNGVEILRQSIPTRLAAVNEFLDLAKMANRLTAVEFPQTTRDKVASQGKQYEQPLWLAQEEDYWND